MRSYCLPALLLVASVWGTSTHSAEIEVSPTSTGDLAVITVTGAIRLADGDRFATVASAHNGALVAFSSDGGNLLAGLRIGQLIRLRHFVTLVPDGARCASACAIAWLGGVQRFMQPTALIGFHAAFSMENGVATETGAGNALVGAYLSRLGLSDAAILYIEQAHPNQITWLTKTDAEEVGIEVAVLPPLEPRARVPRVTPDDRPVPPSPPTPVDTPIARTAALFAAEYFSHWSETNTDALAYFASVYAERVEFYGKPISRSLVLDQKRKFAERWPERVYTVRPSTITARCNDATATCVLQGIVDWDARNAERGARSAGAANFVLRVSVQHNVTTIESESGSVITRETSGQ